MASLFVFYMNKRNYMEYLGFEKPELGMILVGASFGLLADIPIVISRHVLLNINLGGALIPIIVSASLFYKKRPKILWLIISTIIVALMAYGISRFEPGLGIVAEFPYYFAPSMLALGFALLFERKPDKRVTHAYTSAVIGTIIGADFVRIPLLIEERVLGSFGGAGMMDLVYLSGLIAAIPIVIHYYPTYRYSVSDDPLDLSLKKLRKGKTSESVHYAKLSVSKALWKASKLLGDCKDNYRDNKIGFTGVMRKLNLSTFIIEDLKTLMRRDFGDDPIDSQKAFTTAKLMNETIFKSIKDKYTSLPRRVVAYLIDLSITSLPFFLIFYYLVFVGRHAALPGLFSPLVLAVSVLMISVQFIYFTIMEWYFGTTVGKSLFGLKVVNDSFEDITFVESAGRNSARYADMFLFFYIVSLVLIVTGKENKRIGDHVAGTRVVKVK